MSFSSVPALSIERASSRISFVQIDSTFVTRKGSQTSQTRRASLPSRRQIHTVASADQKGERKPWDLGRFVQTVLFFNEPPSLQSVVQSVMQKLSGSSPSTTPSQPGQETNQQGPGVVLVVGATGGVGKRVVDVLKHEGIPVRAMVRNLEKAKKLLGDDVELVAADITQPATLQPSFFRGVTAVVNCASVLVGPKEGDTDERSKYYQGIKFFDPEIKGDTPEAVEFIGMRNLLQKLLPLPSLAPSLSAYAPIFEANASSSSSSLSPVVTWGPLDDVVMGGVSRSVFKLDETAGPAGSPAGVFEGLVSTDNNGGFTSVRTKNFSPARDLSAYSGLSLRVFGDGQRYKLIVRTSSEWDALGYTTSFDTEAGEWQTIRLPFFSFLPVFRAKTVPDAPPLDASSVTSLQLMLSKFEYDGQLNPKFSPGSFRLPVVSIGAYAEGVPVTPRFVHVGSAGVTRPDRPGLDLSKQPPAVRMNSELGGILTFKLKGEDLIRDSGLPYCIVRPCALTEEPAGAELEFAQGDNITGKIGREEVARIVVSALKNPTAANKTFEVKSTVPFSQPFTVDPENPPAPRDYSGDFATLKTGITGKEALQQGAAAVLQTS